MVLSANPMENKLLALAQEAAEKAYAPYSHFPVGAAVLGENGKIYTGCNIENISFGLTNCAERTAIFNMVSDGCRKFKAIGVTADSPVLSAPCGACRQVLAEFAETPEVPVYISNGKETLRETVKGILPHAFTSIETNAR